MISEKTVELNVTCEVLHFAQYLTKRSHYAVGPTLREEGHLGFDVRFGGNGLGLLLQYKRAYVENGVWTWLLNRTKLRDQHLRLQYLSLLGLPVFYAFPYFHTEVDVARWRKQLLAKTFAVSPLAIRPHGGPSGHHEVRFDTTTGRWWVNPGEPVPIETPLTLDNVLSGVLASERVVAGSLVATLTNAALFGGDSEHDILTSPVRANEENFIDHAAGLTMIAQLPE